MKYFDTHAHYFDKWITAASGGAEALLDRLFSENVEAIVNVATNPENLAECIAQAQKYPEMYVAAGIHPEDCLAIDDADTALCLIESNLQSREQNKIVAIGEIGLDYHVEGLTDEDKKKQKQFFERQMQLARKYDLPTVIHDREAHGDCFEMTLKYPDVKGIFHSYSGSPEMARELTRRGWYISFSGVVTFKNANKVRETVRVTPRDKILIETDAPYLAPTPNRGKMNHSGNLEYTCRAIAEILEISEEEVAQLTSENAKRAYKLSKNT